MRFLLDTNAISELRRPRPDEGFILWFAAVRAADLALSVLTVGEIWKGANAVPSGRRQAELKAWIDRLLREYDDRLLPIDRGVATVWAELTVRTQRAGRTTTPIDELIAATAIVHGLAVVTRNLRDFEATGCAILCPWRQ